MTQTTAFEPIAIIGIGCRMPGGVRSPAQLWDLLAGGIDAVGEMPADRFDLARLFDPDPSRPGRIYTRWGGFLDGLDQFDAAFFGISPREAVHIDPQHRLLLETAWEAFEDAGLPPDRAAGTATGVFVGMSTHDYGDIQMYPANRLLLDHHSNTGTAVSIAANRLSYFFDLRGPSLAVDTACSSALTAVHLACASLRAGECGLAIAGGVHIMLTPEPTMGFCRATMLSPTGRCRAFDAGGDGYVRSEGVGVVLLKPLAEAIAAGDAVYAVIRGTAVNQDGRSAGLTVPSAPAHEAMMRRALEAAGVEPRAVQYVEAHGTGTPVGDPIEARAIGAVMRPPSGRAAACAIGSVKTNIGHLEAASGIAGLIKTALALSHRQIPASLHFERPNPAIDFDALRLRVVTALEPWPAAPGEGLAGINSFGFGGANAHVVLGEAPAAARRNGGPSPTPPGPTRPEEAAAGAAPARAHLMTISARSDASLAGLTRDYAAHLERTPELSPRELSAAATMRRAHHPHRLAVVGATREEMLDGLEAFAAGDTRASIAAAKAPATAPKLAFVFSGMGTQWWGMARALLRDEPIFMATVAACDRALEPLKGWSIIEQLAAGESRSRMRELEVAQVCGFAVQLGLVALLKSWGIVPDAVLGHSAGELAAAHVAGVHDFEDAVQLVHHRSRLQSRTQGQGRMLAAGVPPGEVTAWLARHGDAVSLAAINGPRSITLSGDAAALAGLEQELQAQSAFARFVPVDAPFHSARMDPVRAELADALRGLRTRAATVRLVSTVTGTWTDGTDILPEYWWRNLREPVQFAAGIGTLIDAGVRTFLEIGPHPVLAASVRECLAAAGATAAVLGTLRRDGDDRTNLLRTLAGLYVEGRAIDWAAVVEPAPPVPLPVYRWDTARHWFEPAGDTAESRDWAAADNPASHPLLQRRLPIAQPAWESRLSDARLSWIQAHRINGAAVFPGAGYVEAAVAAATALRPGEPVRLTQVQFARVLFVAPDAGERLQVTLDGSGSRVAIHAGSAATGWTHHAAAAIGPQSPAAAVVDLPALRARCSEPVDRERCYADLASRGLDYGPAFRGLASIWRGESEALASIDAAALEPTAPDPAVYHLHPALLDAAFQLLFVAAPDEEPEAAPALFLPVRIDEVRVYGPLPTRCWVHARARRTGAAQMVGDVRLMDDSGTLVADVRGLGCQRVEARAARTESMADWLYEYGWEPRAVAAAADTLAVDAGFGQADVSALDLAGAIDALERRTGFPTYYDVEGRLDQVAVECIMSAFHDLGWPAGVTAPIRWPEVAARIPAARQPFMRRLLDILVRHGRLREERGGTWTPIDGPGGSDPAAVLNRVRQDYPQYETELALLARSGAHLSRNLTGEVLATETLFAGATALAMERFYSDAPSMGFANLLLGETVAALAGRRRPPPEAADAPLRVLEVGGGTAGSTPFVLAALEPLPVEYTFSDVSAVFVERAAARWRDRASFTARVLDIERDPDTQGLPAGRFDVVVASNVVHATADIRVALGHLRTLLAPGGTLVLTEITRRPAWLDVIVGLTDGWWRFRDRDLRPDHALLDQAGWNRVLTDAGFDAVACLSDAHQPGDPAQTVFVAREPSRVSGPAAVVPSSSWLVLADRAGVAAGVVEQLAARGGRATLVEGQAALAAHLADAAASPAGIVHCLGIDLEPPPEGGDGGSAWLAQQAKAAAALVSLGRSLAGLRRERGWERADLWVVTSGGQPVDGDGLVPGGGTAVEQAALWGLGRVLMLEEPDIRCRLIDVGRRPDSSTLELFARLLDGSVPASAGEEELALRDGRLFVRRLTRARVGQTPLRLAPDGTPVAAAWRAGIDTPGALQTISFRTMPAPVPGPGEVAVRIAAASINFRDVMLAMGMIPGLESEASFGHQHLGLDAAGTVLACGDGVTGFTPGDPVVAIVPGAFAASSVTRAELVAPLPLALQMEQGAGVPCAFVTAHYALNRLARIAPGDRVLIHAATGGVGLAALQIARRAGATVFATAGSPEKRAWLTAHGVEHVMDSRSLAFADEILERTGGEGVDVVLNSLAGEALTRSLALLRPYGRFLEIGKRDIYEDSQLGLLVFRRNLSFFAIDLDRLCAERPALVSELLREVMEDFARGSFEPLPSRTFPMAALEDALRFMAQARHIGKVVLSQGEAPPPVVPAGDAPLLRAHGTYLVTGGLGGFGLAVAGWLCRQGARHLVLMGRRGVTAATEAAVEALRGSGTVIEVVTGDVSSEADVRAVLDRIRATLPPLRGVFHAAMVLEDGPLAEMDAARFAKVMAPKMAGAWHLHRQTAKMELDAFVLFSSMSSLLGNPQQANYCAANAFLDALAHARRQAGLPAVAINWGVLSDVGYVSQHQGVSDFLARQGYDGFSPQQALDVLEWVMRHDVAQLMAGRVDWPRWAVASASRAASPRMRDLVPTEEAPGGGRAAAPDDLAQHLRGLAGAARAGWLEDYLRGKVARILGASAATLDLDRPLTELGTDSLTAVELTTALGVDLGVEVPLVRVLQGGTTRSLAAAVLEQLGSAGAPDAAGEQGESLSTPAAAVAPVAAPVSPAGPVLPVAAPVPPAAPVARVVPAASSESAAAAGAWSGRRRWARTAIGLGFRALTDLRVDGLDHLPAHGPCIVAVNHLSLLDAPLVMTVLPRPATLLAADYLQRSPAGWILDRFGHAIYVKRGEADRAALEEAIDVLRAGGVLALGPEGTRSPTGGLGRGLSGVALLATEVGVPVVPLAAWGQERMTESWKGLRRAPVQVRIGPPLHFARESAPSAALLAHTDRVMRALAALLPPRYRGVYADPPAEPKVAPCTLHLAP